MASLYSNQYQDAYIDNPSERLAPGDYNGRVRHIAFKFEPSAAFGTSDVVKLCKLPKGAKIIGAELSSDTGVTNGTDLDLGWAASSDGNEAADADGIFDGVDLSVAAIETLNSYVGRPAYLKDFDAEVDIQLITNVASTGADSEVIEGYLVYVIA